MNIRTSILCATMALITSTMFAQGDRGTITGTIADPAGAVVADAPIQVRNVETGSPFQAAGTNTGNYTFTELPAGSYELV